MSPLATGIDQNPTASFKQTFLYDRYGNRNFDEDPANTTTLTWGCLNGQDPAICPADREKENPEIEKSTNRIKELQPDGDQQKDYEFDAAGNMTLDPDGRQFFYDGDNKQIRVENINDEPIGEYVFDGDGRRVMKKVYLAGGNIETTVFVYDAGGKLVAEYSTTVASQWTAEVSYLTEDHQGSPRITTDKDGKVYSRRDFLPFGEHLDIGVTSERTDSIGYSADSVRQNYTGYERDDESESDFAKARYFKSALGRFNSVDPLRLSAPLLENPQNLNRYVYTRNSPLTYVDSEGLCSAPANLKKGQVGICIEAFIARERIGGIGHGDNRTHNGNNPSLTARMRIIFVVSASKDEISVDIQEKTVSPSSAGVPTVIVTPMGVVRGKEITATLPAKGTVDATYNKSASRNSKGTEGFGDSTVINASLSDGANGFQALGEAMKNGTVAGADATTNAVVKVAGAALEAAAPVGTIDLNATISISGSGSNISVNASPVTARPFPSYTGYVYIVGDDGKVATRELFRRDENADPSDLAKPMIRIQ